MGISSGQESYETLLPINIDKDYKHVSFDEIAQIYIIPLTLVKKICHKVSQIKTVSLERKK